MENSSDVKYILALVRDIRSWKGLQRNVNNEPRIRTVRIMCAHNDFDYSFDLQLAEDQKKYKEFEELLFDRLRKAILES